MGMTLEEAANPDLESYENFERLFTRALHAQARPLATGTDPVCPVDGALSGYGPIDRDVLVQAKGLHYSLTSLLASPETANAFEGGWYATAYLAPADYHRVHSPLAMTLEHVVHVPGTCYPVYPAAVRTVENLFVQNERVVFLGKTDTGAQVAWIAVAAFGVGNIRVPCVPELVTNAPGRQGHTPRTWPVNIQVQRGEEIATFALGSTVLMVFDASFAPTAWHTLGKIRMGARLFLESRPVSENSWERAGVPTC